MTPFAQASAFYSRTPYKSGHLTSLLEFHIREGCVVSTPRLFMMARPAVSTWSYAFFNNDPIPLHGRTPRVWFIEYLAGDFDLAVLVFPFWLPYIAFERRGRLKVYATAALINRILKDAPVENGPTDPLSRRRWRGQSQDPAAPFADLGRGEPRQSTHS